MIGHLPSLPSTSPPPTTDALHCSHAQLLEAPEGCCLFPHFLPQFMLVSRPGMPSPLFYTHFTSSPHSNFSSVLASSRRSPLPDEGAPLSSLPEALHTFRLSGHHASGGTR